MLSSIGRAVLAVGSVSVASDAQWMVQQSLDAFGRLDFLCNIAGGAHASGSVVEVDEAEYQRVMDNNLLSIYLMSKYALPAIIASGGGAVVNIASTSGLVPEAQLFTYCTAKAAAIQPTRCMATSPPAACASTASAPATRDCYRLALLGQLVGSLTTTHLPPLGIQFDPQAESSHHATGALKPGELSIGGQR